VLPGSVISQSIAAGTIVSSGTAINLVVAQSTIAQSTYTAGTMTTALDIVTGALQNINVIAAGEPVSSQDAQIGLTALNDLLESLSNDENFVYTQVETVFPWVAGQFQYSVGNYVGGTFTGTLTVGSQIITGVTVPSAVTVGGTITDAGGVLPSGTVILAIGTNNVTISNAPTTLPAINPDTFTYTIPGNIAMARPLRFRDGFTRATTSANANLDYSFEFVSFDRYKEELLKNVQGPWPYIAAYQPTFPLGTLYVYPAPSANYTAHLFSDLVLSDYATITSTFSLPQGYSRALKKLLALELAPSYGKTVTPELRGQAKEAKDYIKGTNDTPVVTLRYDSAISRSQTQDAGWITHGGF
jgi:hypothetical protein